MSILAGTGNRFKIRELQSVGVEFGVQILDPYLFSRERGDSGLPEVSEEGLTYRDNALMKARQFSAWSGLPALGDDSGLEVAALSYRPGLYSARYGGPGLSDTERVERLLEELRELERVKGSRDRRAWFCCSLALFVPGCSGEGEIFFADVSLEGEVLDEPRGSGGFGYDPIIYLPSIGATLAEVDFATTSKRGFRAEAARRLLSKVKLMKPCMFEWGGCKP